MPIPVLSSFDFNKTELLNARLQNLGVDPTGLTANDRGLFWIDGAGTIKFWDGTAVQTLGLATGGNAETLDGEDSAYFLSRANHTGTQAAATISDLPEAVQDVVGNMVSGTQTNITVAYNDADGTLSFNVPDAPDPYITAIGDTSTVDLTVNSGTLTAEVLDSPTVGGQTPANLRDRSTHTGTQNTSTISDFAEAVQDVVGSVLGDSATVDVTYDDAGNQVTFTVLDAPSIGGNTAAQLRDRSTHTGTQTAASISNFDAQVRTSRLDQMAGPTAAVGFNNQKITGLANGTATADAATYGQLLAVVEGKTWKDPVRAATTGNITLSGAQTIDGVSLTAGDRVLVKNQSSAGANGIYVVAAGAWTRAADANAAGELNNATVIVQQGASNQGDVFTQTSTIATLGTTAQSWVKTGEGNQTYGADGSTLVLNGSTFSVGTITGDNLGTGAVDLDTDKVTGVLPSDKGGTGQSTYTAGDLLVGADGNTLTKLPAAADGNVLRSNGASAAPSWSKVDLSSDTADTALPVAKGGTGASSAANARTALGAPGKYAVDIGGSTAITVTHNLNTRDVQVSVYRNSTPWDTVMVDVERTTLNTCTIRFATAPAANAFRCVVVG